MRVVKNSFGVFDRINRIYGMGMECGGVGAERAVGLWFVDGI
jgi:hypothetical protein